MHKLGDSDKMITARPFEFQPSVESFDIMEQGLLATSNLLNLPHCHVPPSHFPPKFEGKIIFVERDPRAVVVSGFHFFNIVFKEYMEALELDDVNKFARHVFEGKFLYGKIEEFNQKWKTFAAENPNLSILFLKYEGNSEIGNCINKFNIDVQKC